MRLPLSFIRASRSSPNSRLGDHMVKKRKAKKTKIKRKQSAKKNKPKSRRGPDENVLPTTDEAIEREGTYLPPTTVGCSGPF
jgi:hypothetical protein